MEMAKVRLYVEHPLGEGQSVPLSREQAHYLFSVMRLDVGDAVALFNSKDGEFLAAVAQAGKKGGTLVCQSQTRPLQLPPDLWLLFAPIKKARTDFIVEKAVEMGARRIMPVLTQRTNSERIRRDRLQAHAVEAAEQCGATYVPQVMDLARLAPLLDAWPSERGLMFCDEDKAGVAAGLTDGQGGPWAILIGPEGGFDDKERKKIAAMKQSVPVSLGPRILRADTAAVAAMTLWQITLGDWV